MIGVRLLYQIEKRCREIFPTIKEPFGGLNIYLIGAFRQLPPVKDLELYSTLEPDDVMATEGLLLIKEFDKFIEL